MFYGQCWKCGQRWELGTASTCTCPDEIPKREWQGLTDEEVEYMWRVATMKPGLTLPMVRSFARAIEAKLKEKNT